MQTRVALLRGINVGGKNLLPMPKLIAIFERCGAASVRSYIQSGNIIFRANDALAEALPSKVGKYIEKDFGFSVPMVIRTAEELRAIAAVNPLLEESRIEGPLLEKWLQVVFLASAPSKAQIDSVDPNRSPPDVFTVRGREIYMYFPNGMARTKLTSAYLDSKLGTMGTGRNWNTLRKLIEMMT